MFEVRFSPRSKHDLSSIERYIQRSSFAIAERYVTAIVHFCLALGSAPHRGEERPHLRPGLRTTGYKDRISILFSISDRQQVVRIVRILYAGRQPTRKPHHQS